MLRLSRRKERPPVRGWLLLFLLPNPNQQGESVTIHKKVSKLIDDSYSASFGNSGGRGVSFCDASCRLWKLCYASKLETLRANVRNSLANALKAGAIPLLQSIMDKMPRRFAWMRWSVFGSIPSSSDLGDKWPRFAAMFREANEMALESGAEVHLPVESKAKAKELRDVLSGLPIVVRRSDQSETVDGMLKATDPRSYVVGDIKFRPSEADKARNLELATKAAKRVRATGQTAVVCPYPRLKCGQCRACASPCVDVVIYPYH